MKKLLLISILLFSFILPYSVFWVTCDVKVDEITKDWTKVWDSLNNCLKWSSLVDWSSADISATWWFQKNINKWVWNLATFFWILAIWFIVYWGILMTLSWWEEEKIKKAKNIVKWWIIWFLWIVSASTIIVLVVNIMYSLEV